MDVNDAMKLILPIAGFAVGVSLLLYFWPRHWYWLQWFSGCCGMMYKFLHNNIYIIYICIYIYISMYIISTFIIFIQYLHLLFCFLRSSDAISTVRSPPARFRPPKVFLTRERKRAQVRLEHIMVGKILYGMGYRYIYVWYIHIYIYTYMMYIIIYTILYITHIYIYNIGITDLSSNLFVIFQWEVHGCRWWKHCPDFEKQSFQVRSEMWRWQVADVYELSHDTKRIRLSLGSPTTTLGSLATEAG